MDDEFLSKYAGFDSVEEDRKLRLFAVNSYIPLLRGEPGKLPQRFLQVISWVSDALTMWIINRLLYYYVIRARRKRTVHAVTALFTSYS